MSLRLHRVVGIALLSFALGGVATLACSSTDSTNAPVDGGTESAAARSDSGGSADLDAGQATMSNDAGPVNLLVNGGFSNGCADWMGENATLSDDSTPERGKACRVCSASVQPYAIKQAVVHAVVPEDRYLGEAWLRETPEGTGSPLATSAHISEFGPAGLIQEGDAAAGPMANKTWQHITATASFTADGGTQVVFFATVGGPGQCFLIDDAALYKQ